ncbi:uncharacterized protein LOC126677613 [Mercurialis annua]|uniref:uncharacterized protein LOC126677613 n=1 Tax=Mercurialis annua TaxID=3986 RepID=UPI00215F3C7B|nr:uncharacterized protein LOC126677613 [Mercurialis annua]
MMLVAEEKQMTLNLKSVNRWLNQLKEAAYDAEDVLEEVIYEDLRRTLENQNQEKKFCMFQTPVLGLPLNMEAVAEGEKLLSCALNTLKTVWLTDIVDHSWLEESNNQ